jgi:hypothetical protein
MPWTNFVRGSFDVRELCRTRAPVLDRDGALATGKETEMDQSGK